MSAVLDTRAATLPRGVRQVTPQDIDNIREHRRALIERDFRNLVLQRELGGYEGELAEEMIEHLEMEAADLKSVLVDHERTKDPRFDFDAVARSVVEEGCLDAPQGSTEFALVKRAIREGELQGRLDGFDIVYLRKPLVQSAPPLAKAPKISAVLDAYVARQDKRRTIVGIREAQRRFVESVGDLRLDQIQAEHFRKFCAAEAAADVGGRSRGSVQRPRSASTIQKKVTFLRAAINHAINTGAFQGTNPATGIVAENFARPTPDVRMPDKRPFNIAELNAVLAYPWFTGCESSSKIHVPGDHRLGGMWYWAPVVALLTGCRAGEIGGLMLSEIMLDDQFPHIMVRNNQFRTTKGKYARNVPLLDQLIELGFGSFVERQRQLGATRLFEDWKAPAHLISDDDLAWSNGKMVRAFNTTLIPKALSGRLVPQARREVTFHSFRGAFKTLLHLQRYGVQPNYINEVVGHAKNGLDQRYIGTIPLEETYAAVRKCRYEGLNIPSAPPLS